MQEEGEKRGDGGGGGRGSSRRRIGPPARTGDGGYEGSPFVYRTMTCCRAMTVALPDFGGVGDGVTSNTRAFQSAVAHLAQAAPCSSGGGQFFNLTSCFTLYLHRDAVILGSQGRDAPGGRYSSLILGSNLTDVAITGDNGTIDGQGAAWWSKFRSHNLRYTRGYLIELLFSDQILISNLTLVNSPSWNVHPVYSRSPPPPHTPPTILGFHDDDHDPYSCSQVRIEDCYIVSGDDCIAIKSGWDEYGIAMSGGIEDVRAEDITAVDTESGVRIKTAVGRGAYVKDIFVKGFVMKTMTWAFWMTGNYGSHADDGFDPAAVPVVSGISYSDITASNVTTAGRLEGIPGAPFTGSASPTPPSRSSSPRRRPGPAPTSRAPQPPSPRRRARRCPIKAVPPPLPFPPGEAPHRHGRAQGVLLTRSSLKPPHPPVQHFPTIKPSGIIAMRQMHSLSKSISTDSSANR
ncbi:unnamed protein product [Spirodela intermedia]|uniref:Uncharacterized protein n=1 Tax=Spirodela intermedia TaxID=51605 RepID=A0A7I8JK51_SPIIN|nr:unnamed protein product [Spirodela intermedia]CAA6669822.1 unnamed protein product [Spirodela intermedia]